MKKVRFMIQISVWLLVCAQSKGFGVSRTRNSGEVNRKDSVNGEPSCEELKAMWRLSKRQSRAAEVTNEIPTFRDPFSYNVWEPYYVARSRSMGGMRLGRFNKDRPVYGTVVHKAPSLRFQDMAGQKVFEEVARTLGTNRFAVEPRRRASFRLGGGRISPVRYSPSSGSFQHLKELIRTERARELQEQRMAEEVAARAAARKHLSGHGNYRNPTAMSDAEYNYDEQSDYPVREGIVAFPDILAQAARVSQEEYQPQDYYSKEIPYYKSHRSSYYDMSSLNNDMDGFSL
ncbi:uncharacterized protein LOC108737579 [Agrilus planipennis]|uniref:Uncharacterized protein LOC108737579 n=1 Tax=Agrilus planipennis TaxID=224129 RepID=A0A1W4WQ16_AGRPL|nr:uncharacterized protein LOC108737579 [Agrilus planipennis]XP_018326003.1 uncharacterized protein LOC108737579 [Agrilus planipennis]XP_018326004.1 uncharacterized protein LOC108737579 [Agrilus planipennis]